MKRKGYIWNVGLLISMFTSMTLAISATCYSQESSSRDQGEFVTFTDDAERSVKIQTPIESFVYHGHNSYVYETLRAIGVSDKIVGVSDRFTTAGGNRYSEAYFPELSGLKNVGLLKTPDYEVINTLKPDVVISDEERYYEQEKTPRVSMIALDVKPTTFKENTMKYGTLFDREEEAKEFVGWYSKWEDELQKRTAEISEEEKPLVYIGYYDAVKYGSKTFQLPAKDNYRNLMIHMAGGRGMGDEISGSGMPDVDAEWIITRNPDVMIFSASTQYVGYDVTDPSKAKALIDDFMKRPEFAGVKAVKNNRVYIVSHSYILCGGASGLIGSVYYAKWIYPELFADIDPVKIHQEFITTFQRVDLDVQGRVCVYPTK